MTRIVHREPKEWFFDEEIGVILEFIDFEGTVKSPEKLRPYVDRFERIAGNDAEEIPDEKRPPSGRGRKRVPMTAIQQFMLIVHCMNARDANKSISAVTKRLVHTRRFKGMSADYLRNLFYEIFKDDERFKKLVAENALRFRKMLQHYLDF